MTAKDIYPVLFQMFANYEYALNNTYVFDWESDFFACSKSGYFVECEVKVSRSDFFVDFKKEKHRLFQDIIAGKSHHIIRDGIQTYDSNNQNIICQAQYAWMQTEYGDFEKNHRHGRETTMVRSSWNPWKLEKVNGKTGYWANDYGRIAIVKHTETLYAKFCRIRIKEIKDILVPHRFYYAVPEGMVKVEEVPKYAGLIYISEGGFNQVKAAPFLHKRSMDLTRILLKKYYNLWVYKVPWETKKAIRGDYSEK